MSETNGREKGLDSDKGVELLHAEGYEEHEAFSRRDAGLSAGVRQTGRRGLSVSLPQTGCGKTVMKDGF